MDTFSKNDERILNSFFMNLIQVPGGEFLMGSPDGMTRDCADLAPLHYVDVDNFYMSKYLVTQEQFEMVMGYNPSSNIGVNLPVESVSWDEAREFVNRLSKVFEVNFRLPTEEEWEYAARGGHKNHGYKYSGSNRATDVAWYNCKHSHPVGTKQPNELGAYDMSGNVKEWCESWMGLYIGETAPDVKDTYKVVRGGSFNTLSKDCAVWERSWAKPIERYADVGFRYVISKADIDKSVMEKTGAAKEES